MKKDPPAAPEHPAVPAPACAPVARGVHSARSVLSALAALLLSTAPPASATPSGAAPTWVLFRDRGACGAADRAAPAPSSRALERRAKAARERAALGVPASTDPDEDCDPCAAYVDAVVAAGGALRTRSRWLNAVSVDADRAALEGIRALPFVLETRPVAQFSRDELASPPGAQTPDAADEFDLGPAARQLDMLHVPEAHAMGYHGEGVLVCVLDTGFELGHEALAQLSVRAEYDFIHGDDDPSDDPRTDLPGQSNHGTQVLSILAGYAPGRLVGPAYRAEFLLGKTERIGVELPIEEDYWCAGVEWAEAMGADVLSSSLSYPSFYRWHDMDGRTAAATRAANLAAERGLIIANSAGNQGPGEGRIGPPADAPGVISVGAVDANGRIAAFSTPGPTWDRRVKPDVSAMGVQVTHVVPRTRDRYGRGNGTSYSTPLVAGCIALVLEAHPDWGPEMVREAVVMSADRVSRPDNRYGWGVVNVRDAILYPQIEGRVTDFTTREPVARARITWEPAGAVDTSLAVRSDSPARGETGVDSTGAYVIPSLPRGAYRLHVRADGYLDAASEPIEVPPGIGDVSFELRYRGR